MMRTKEFIEKLEHDRIVKRDRRGARSKTSGEIRVFVQHGEVDDPVAEPRRRNLQRLGMTADPRAQRRPHLRRAAFAEIRRDRRRRDARDDAATDSGSSWSRRCSTHFQRAEFHRCRGPCDRGRRAQLLARAFSAAARTIATSCRTRSKERLEPRDLQSRRDGVHSPSRCEFLNVAPLVPGFPSLDAKPRSPGGTRRFLKGRNRKAEG